MSEPKTIQLRNPDPKKKMPSIDIGAHAALRRTALAVVPREQPGITLDEYLDEMKARLPEMKGWDSSASPGWYAMAIKLDLEVRGELKRMKGKPPQRLVRA